MEKAFTNRQIVEVINGLNALTGRRMPIGILLAIRRSAPELEAANKAYAQTLTDLCGQYGVTVQTINDVAEGKRVELAEQINDLLSTETTVNIHPINPALLDDYDDAKYDPLTYTELNTLYMLVMED